VSCLQQTAEAREGVYKHGMQGRHIGHQESAFRPAITELAESQVSDQTIMAIAGHVSQKMLARDSHVRSEARRQAVAALSAKPTGQWFRCDETTGYDTNDDTKDNSMEVSPSEVV